MKKLFPVSLMAILILAVALSGCGGGGGGGTTHTPGEASAYTVGGVSFTMRYVPGGLTFPTKGFFDIRGGGYISPSAATVNNAYLIAETEVTYELWNKVKIWASTNGYAFSGGGIAGSSGSGDAQEPVTTISWREAMIWCNALTEYYNATNTDGISLTCVYVFSNSDIARDATSDSCDSVTASSTAKGFRLPTGDEWELAARYIGTVAPTTAPLSNEKITLSGIYWTPGNYASGASGDYTNTTPTGAVAVYNTSGTAIVKSKGVSSANALGLYDMSGNVSEFCFDVDSRDARMRECPRGGCWSDKSSGMQLAINNGSINPTVSDAYYGFRFVRTN